MAPKKQKRRRSLRTLRPVATNCQFCKGHTEPDYKNTGELTKFISDRAKIIPKSRSGLCTKHQRVLARQIKRARGVGLLPYGY